MNGDIDVYDGERLESSVALADYTIYKRYLSEISNYPVVKESNGLIDQEIDKCTRFCKLKELTCKKGEDIFQKLSTVYNATTALGCSLVVMIDVKNKKAPADIYIGIKNANADIDDVEKNNLKSSFQTLQNGMMSNFPGIKMENVSADNHIENLVDDIFGENTKYISATSCVASVREKDKTQNKEFVQGLEKFIDAMTGNTYTAVFIAEPITKDEQAVIRNGYENLYSNLSVFSKTVMSYSQNESEAVMQSISNGVSESITEGINNTQAHTNNIGVNIGINRSIGEAHTVGSSISKRGGMGVSLVGKGVGTVGSIVSLVNPAVGGTILAAGGIISSVGSFMSGKTYTDSESFTNSVGRGFSGGINGGHSKTSSETISNSTTNGTSWTETSGETQTIGKSESIQIEQKNKAVEELLKRIDAQLKRLQEGEDYGSYSCGAYFITGKEETSMLAANTYRSLLLGEGSSIEANAVNYWRERDDKEKFNIVKDYIKHFTHPIFALSVENGQMLYTPTTIVSGLELPFHLGFPTKSVYGLPVIEHAEFGRNVTNRNLILQPEEEQIEIGKIYHMGQIQEKARVELNLPELTAHTFITGSTGAGKTNTVCQILDKLSEKGIKFLVVEPAKGEYKGLNAFGRRSDVSIYGTNNKTKEYDLLRINPFSFPSGTHVLEHLDRLVEIFNVCWPMYAAMPAVLKDSIQRAYEKAGWDIETSENSYDNAIFPSFTDVFNEIKQVLKESEYSDDNKSDYTGALVTRLKSLTNGINGLVFSADEISSEDLFNKNVIVDLSRVGSSETKSLIMGILVLKLQEYRMDEGQNPKLKHVTVLEEAHNLLRRTSFDQSSEGSNLLGKSVEMLSNSIAEMRAYGEGFIIADQAPGLLDMSVIRNTNTKIILRLPDLSDCELVGHAAGLNDDQISEISKLENGVAVVKQGEWLEPVLSKINKFEPKYSDNFIRDSKVNHYIDSQKLKRMLIDMVIRNKIYDQLDLRELKDEIIKSKLSAIVKCGAVEYVCCNKKNEKTVWQRNRLIYELTDADRVFDNLSKHKFSSVPELCRYLLKELEIDSDMYDREQIELLLGGLMTERSDRNFDFADDYRKITEFYNNEGRMI